ncbi:MAG: hypothetical protein SPJ83_04720, partial [Helicobacter sp.]|nr:hypothetical protein [Helicobacter sp.]
EIYKISNIKKRLKEVKKAYNLVQEKGLHRFDYPQTNKDVSATPQHDKETPKTTKEIIKEYSDEYENNLFALMAEQKKILAEREKLENGHPQLAILSDKYDELEKQIKELNETALKSIKEEVPRYDSFEEVLQTNLTSNLHGLALKDRIDEIGEKLSKELIQKHKKQPPTKEEIQEALNVIKKVFKVRSQDDYMYYKQGFGKREFNKNQINDIKDAYAFRKVIEYDKTWGSREYYDKTLDNAYATLDKVDKAKEFNNKGIFHTDEYSKMRDEHSQAITEISRKMEAYNEKVKERFKTYLETLTNTQTNKDVSLNAQHDKEIPANTHEKETPKTTREIIDEAKESGRSVRETQELIDKNKELDTNVKENTYIIPQTTQEIIKEHSKIDFATLANMPHHADDIKQVENLKAERQKLYDELAEIFDKNERHGFLDLVGKLYKTETQALKRFNEIKQDLKEGKGIRNVSNSTFNKDEYITKVGQADALNTEIDYLEVPRSLREKYPKIDKQILTNVYKKSERFQRSYKDLEDYFKDVAETKIEHVLNRYPLESWETMRENYKIKDKALAKGRELEYARQEIEALLNVTPIVEFGKNYAEFYRNGSKAIQKLMAEKEGQVAGAFYREELGDIDLVWGQVEGKGKEAKGYGLAKIIEKHLNAGDFKAFGEGEAGLINAMSEIIDKGKVITQNGVSTIVHKH